MTAIELLEEYQKRIKLMWWYDSNSSHDLEFRYRVGPWQHWQDYPFNEVDWDWDHCDYRIKE
jgi:hypothetical protein